MSLSNTATPKYYGEFREKVIAGIIPVCKEVSQAMNLIDMLIDDPNIYYDDEAVEGFIRFCENELTLVDGSDLVMCFTFKLWAEDIFGWYYFDEKTIYEVDEYGSGQYVTKTFKIRLRNKQYIITGRSAAKSLFLTCVHSYFLVVDTTTTHQITTAPVMKLSEEVMNPFETAIARSRGPLFKFLTEGSLQNTTGSKRNRQKLASTKVGIENFLTNSYLEIRPLKISKLQGLRCKVATLDEWLSGELKEDPIGAIEQGAHKVNDWLIIAASSEGNVRNGAGDSIKMELHDILEGKYVNPHVSIWYYKLDSLEEVGMPEMWLKANPNLGVTVSYETYQLDVERAEQVPSARNDILAKRFGLPLEGFTYFFTYEETLPSPKKLDFRGLGCSLGADLSQGDDFCAFTFLFPFSNDCFGVKVRSYITDTTYSKLPPALKEKYNEFIAEDTLIVMKNCTILNLDDVYDDLDEHISKCNYDVRTFGFDPYNATTFVERWERENGPFGVEKVPQGVKTESVPLGEIKNLTEEHLLLFDESLMSFTMGNAITIEDNNGNRKLLKRRREEKIDNVAALLDAFIAFKLHKEFYE